MSRKRTGLRNRFRPNGASAYSRLDKRRGADFYGAWERGRHTKAEAIGGHPLSWVEGASYVPKDYKAAVPEREEEDELA